MGISNRSKFNFSNLPLAFAWLSLAFYANFTLLHKSSNSIQTDQCFSSNLTKNTSSYDEISPSLHPYTFVNSIIHAEISSQLDPTDDIAKFHVTSEAFLAMLNIPYSGKEAITTFGGIDCKLWPDQDGSFRNGIVSTKMTNINVVCAKVIVWLETHFVNVWWVFSIGPNKAVIVRLKLVMLVYEVKWDVGLGDNFVSYVLVVGHVDVLFVCMEDCGETLCM